MEMWRQLSERLDQMVTACAGGAFSASKADSLVDYLWQLRSRLPEQSWRRLIDLASEHPIHARFRECPSVDHSIRRPRGYPGDAELIDYAYNGVRADFALPATVSHFGREMFNWFVRDPCSDSLRRRRDFMTQEIASLVERQNRAKVLSVAAGHAREWLPLKERLQCGQVYLTALDQDRASLEEIRATLGSGPVHTINDSIVNLLGGNVLGGKFDLIYSMGLYDYLNDGVAERLTEFLYSDLLAPGGRLLIANYAPGMELAAFIELFMRWDLIYRDAGRMRQLARRIGLADSNLVTVEQIGGGMIVVLVLTSA